MRRVLVILLVSGVYTLSAGESFALPPCPEDGVWNNCFGTYTSGEGTTYAGEWNDDKSNGQGTETYASGDKYVGEFKDGKLHGQGTNTWPDALS